MQLTQGLKYVFMGITNPDNPPHTRQSQILIPMDTDGVLLGQ